MASSEVEIVNSALIKIGERTITSFDDVNRKAARVSARQYPIRRDAMIRRYRWNFAMTRASLAPESPGPAFGFQNRFMLPADCIRLIGLFDDSEPLQNYTSSTKPHKVEGGFVHADGTELLVFYLKKETDVGQFDPLFAEVLAVDLAMDLAYNLSTGLDKLKDLRIDFNDLIAQAKRTDAIEGSPEIIVASDWIDSRDIDVPPRIGPVIW